MSTSEPNPSAILQTAFSFWSSKVLLIAAEFGVFTRLAGRKLASAELGAEMKLHPCGIADFFDALVAMKFLEREGDGPQAKYVASPKACCSSMKTVRATLAVSLSCTEVGLNRFEMIHLAGPSSAAVAYKWQSSNPQQHNRFSI